MKSPAKKKSRLAKPAKKSTAKSNVPPQKSSKSAGQNKKSSTVPARKEVVSKKKPVKQTARISAIKSSTKKPVAKANSKALSEAGKTKVEKIVSAKQVAKQKVPVQRVKQPAVKPAAKPLAAAAARKKTEANVKVAVAQTKKANPTPPVIPVSKKASVKPQAEAAKAPNPKAEKLSKKPVPAKTKSPAPATSTPVLAPTPSAVGAKAASQKPATSTSSKETNRKAKSRAAKPVAKKVVAKSLVPKKKATAVKKSGGATAKALVELPAMAAPKKKLTLNIPALLLEGDYSAGAQPGGPGSRYSLGLPATPGEATADDLVLPESYGTRKVWLVPRDPQWVYAHWDLDNEQQLEYNQLSRDGHLILRIYDADSPGEPITEIHVHPESRSWFAHVGKGGGRYFAVLGFRDKTGDWHEVNRSGPVGTPPDSLSEEVAAEFFTQPSAAVSAPASISVPNEVAPKALSEALSPTPSMPEPQPALITGEASIEPEAVAKLIEMLREYIAEEPQLSRAINQVFDSGGTSGSEKIELPPSAEFAKWTPAQQQALAKVISMDAVREVWAGSNASSIALAESLELQRRRDLASVAAQAIGGPAPAPVPGPAGGAISSPHGAAPRELERSFWFNVNAELVVYGATEPTARVSIGGRVIRLRRDGTFSYRFALPDGEYQLPITAESADGFEARHASLHFGRGTEYHGDVGAHPQDPRLQTPAPEHTA
ncbi:DUF4912 domain-containing protein [bacterium]|nr:DUF4912 domain-containing protein [bacterium]